MGWNDIFLVVAGAMMALEGIMKIAKPNFRFMGMCIPCGWGLIVLGAALVAHAVV